MFNYFRVLLRSLERIAGGVEALIDALHGLSQGPVTDADLSTRLAAVERDMERRHAEAEGLLLRAQGKFEAARAAEERTRRLAERSEESEDDQLDALRAAYAEAGISLDDALGGEGEGVQPVRNGVASRAESRANAYAMKFGRRG